MRNGLTEPQVQQRIKELSEISSICQKVATTLSSPGWTEAIEPLIDKMITDITGCKMKNGRWHGGLLTKARTDEKREFYIGYKQALIDLHRRVYAYNDSLKRYEDERAILVKGPSKKFNTPLVDDTSYGTRGRGEQ